MAACLRDEPLPVCIPTKVFKFPREWCMNDGHDHTSAPDPTYAEIAAMESHLVFFVPFAQGFLTDVLCSLLPKDAAFIMCHGQELGLREMMQCAKYGSTSDPEIQQSMLEQLGARAKSFGFSLGELKTLVYVASLKGSPYMGVSSDINSEMREIDSCRRLLRASWFGKNSVKYTWGGDLGQFKPILEKTLDFFQNKLVLKRC